MYNATKTPINNIVINVKVSIVTIFLSFAHKTYTIKSMHQINAPINDILPVVFSVFTFFYKCSVNN